MTRIAALAIALLSLIGTSCLAPPKQEGGLAFVAQRGLASRMRFLQDTRKRHQPQLVELPDDLTASHQAHPEQLRRRREIVEAFERAAAQLPQAQRTVFVLAEFHALSMAQIGELTGATTATVKTRLHRARRRLRILLSTLWEAT